MCANKPNECGEVWYQLFSLRQGKKVQITLALTWNPRCVNSMSLLTCFKKKRLEETGYDCLKYSSWKKLLKVEYLFSLRGQDSKHYTVRDIFK